MIFNARIYTPAQTDKNKTISKLRWSEEEKSEYERVQKYSII